MRWSEEGGGFPFVLLHGISTGPALWCHVLPQVRGGRLLAFELVGYGESIPAGRDRDISVARQADSLLAWLDHLAIEQAVLVGHDLGGGWRRSPRCTSHGGAQVWCWPTRSATTPGRSSASGRCGRPGRSSAGCRRRRSGRWWLAAGRQPRRPRNRPGVAGGPQPPYERHGGAAALAWQVRWLRTADTLQVADRLGDLQVPARVVWGVADPFQRLPYGQRFAWDLRTELWRIEGGRHFVPEDPPWAAGHRRRRGPRRRRCRLTR
jgi:pimeloyl-ACP methyl ester carboxylesterase